MRLWTGARFVGDAAVEWCVGCGMVWKTLLGGARVVGDVVGEWCAGCGMVCESGKGGDYGMWGDTRGFGERGVVWEGVRGNEETAIFGERGGVWEGEWREVGASEWRHCEEMGDGERLRGCKGNGTMGVGEVWGADRSWGMGRGYGDVRERGREGCERVYECVRGCLCIFFFIYIYIYYLLLLFFF
jgi:hypothetical protein